MVVFVEGAMAARFICVSRLVARVVGGLGRGGGSRRAPSSAGTDTS